MDSQAGDEVPISLTLAMFAESPQEEPQPVVEPMEPPPPPEAVEPPDPPSQTPQLQEKEPEPVLEPPPPEKPRPKPRQKPKPRPVAKKVAPPRSTPAKETVTPKSQPTNPPRTVAPKATTPIPSKPVGAAAAQAKQDYLVALRRRIERKKYYPRASRRRGEEGKVIVSFVIQKNGELIDMAVARSSGIPRLDKAALETLRRISPFKPIPADLGRNRLALSIPISYNLRN